MKFFESIRIGWRSITGHKLRSTLTTLGVIIGIASVIVFMVMGGAFQEDILGDIGDQNDPIIQVSAQPEGGGFTGGPPSQSAVFTQSDVDQVRSIDGVAFVAPIGPLDVPQVNHSGRTVTGGFSAAATSPELFDREGVFELVRGETFAGEGEIVVNTNFDGLFEENVTVGDTVHLRFSDGRVERTTIVGVVEEQASTGNQPGIYTPIDPYYTTTLEDPEGNTERAYQALLLRASSVERLDEVKSSVQTFMQEESDAQQLKPDNHEIAVQTLQDIVDQFTAILDQITIFIGGIAGISLVVGSIGIANIMIVSVTERTREIGIMKAVGAKNRDILQLFLLESVILGAIGAVVGTLLGLGLGYLLVNYLGWPMVYPVDWIAIAVVVGVGVGVVSGLYPAWRAARIDPIEALRRE